MGGKESKVKRPDPVPYHKPGNSPGSGSSYLEYPQRMPVNPRNNDWCKRIIDNYRSLDEV